MKPSHFLCHRIVTSALLLICSVSPLLVMSASGQSGNTGAASLENNDGVKPLPPAEGRTAPPPPDYGSDSGEEDFSADLSEAESQTESRTWTDEQGATHTSYTDPYESGQPQTEVEEIEMPDGGKVTKVTTTTRTIDENDEITDITTIETSTTGKDGSYKVEKDTFETYTKPDGSKVTLTRSDEDSDNADGSSEQTTRQSSETENDGYVDRSSTATTDMTDREGGQSSSTTSEKTTVDQNTQEESSEMDVSTTEADGSRTDAQISKTVKPSEEGGSQTELTVTGTGVDAEGNVTRKTLTTTGTTDKDGSSEMEITEESDISTVDGRTASGTRTSRISDDGKGNVIATIDYEGSDNEGNKLSGKASESKRTTDNSMEVETEGSEEEEDSQGNTSQTEVSGKSSLTGNEDGSISGEETFSGKSTGSEGETEMVEGSSNTLITPGEDGSIRVESDSSVTAEGPQGRTSADSTSELEMGPDRMSETTDTDITGPDGKSANISTTTSAEMDSDGNIDFTEDQRITASDSKGETSTMDSSVSVDIDKDGTGYGEVSTTVSGTDDDGNQVTESTRDGGEMEFGEGRGSAGNNLRDAEPESDVEVDVDTAAGGVNTSDLYGNEITTAQQQRSADATSTMAQNTQMDEASNVGNQQERDAKIIRDRGGRDAGATSETARRKTNKSDRENSWGKAMGDAVESGITEGGKAFGQAFGGAASDAAVGAIFGPKKEASSSGGTSAKSSAAAGGAAAAPATASSSAKGKPKKKPGRGSGGGGGGSGGGRGGEDGDILISTSEDIPVDGAPIDDPIGVTGTSQNDDGTVTITYGCGYTWTGTPPGPSKCPVCNRETVSTDSNSSSSDDEEEDEISGGTGNDEEAAEPRNSSYICGRCGNYPTKKEPPDPGDEHIICYYHCTKCGWKMAMGDGSGL